MLLGEATAQLSRCLAFGQFWLDHHSRQHQGGGGKERPAQAGGWSSGEHRQANAAAEQSLEIPWVRCQSSFQGNTNSKPNGYYAISSRWAPAEVPTIALAFASSIPPGSQARSTEALAHQGPLPH